MILALLSGLASLVCWIMVLVKMFQDEQNGGTLIGIFGILCALWAFVWGWMHAEKHGLKGVMLGWTIAIVVSAISQGALTSDR